MNDHYIEEIPLYVAGELSLEEKMALESHLPGCSICQAELDFWRDLATGIHASNAHLSAPLDLPERALACIHAPSPLRKNFLRAFNLLRSQAYLVKYEMWPALAAVMALGVVIALIAKQSSILTFLAPLAAAASLAAIYGPQNDPACELTLAIPLSPWKILLARLTLVSGYNLLLALAASLALLPILSPKLLGTLILAWLGPLTFLSALALLLSLWIGTNNAITLSYGLWILQYIRPPQLPQSWPVVQAWDTFLNGYRQFWQTPALLLPLALAVIGLALLSTRYSEDTLTQNIA